MSDGFQDDLKSANLTFSHLSSSGRFAAVIPQPASRTTCRARYRNKRRRPSTAAAADLRQPWFHGPTLKDPLVVAPRGRGS